jgi:hypothetical protein
MQKNATILSRMLHFLLYTLYIGVHFKNLTSIFKFFYPINTFFLKSPKSCIPIATVLAISISPPCFPHEFYYTRFAVFAQSTFHQKSLRFTNGFPERFRRAHPD